MRYCSLALNHRHFCLYLCLNKSVDSDWLILTNSLIDSMISVDNYWLIDIPPRTETDHPTINHGWSVGRPRILLFPQHCIGHVVLKMYVFGKFFCVPSHMNKPFNGDVYTAEKICMCLAFRITFPIGHVTTEFYMSWDKIYIRQEHVMLSLV